MPAAVYCSAGGARARIARGLDPMLVAFTTLQTRLFFPVGSLLGVSPRRADIACAFRTGSSSTSTSRSTIEEKPDALTAGEAGDVVFDHVWFRYGEDWTLQDISFTVKAGTTTALVGETGSGKTNAWLPCRPALRRQPRSIRSAASTSAI